MSKSVSDVDGGSTTKQDGRGKHIKHGLAYRIDQASRTAPDGATDGEILQVAQLAHKHDRDAQRVWQEEGGE